MTSSENNQVLKVDDTVQAKSNFLEVRGKEATSRPRKSKSGRPQVKQSLETLGRNIVSDSLVNSNAEKTEVGRYEKGESVDREVLRSLMGA